MTKKIRKDTIAFDAKAKYYSAGSPGGAPIKTARP